MNKITTIIATALLTGTFSLASAAPILSVSTQGLTDAGDAESNFLATLSGGYLTETFDDNTFYTVGSQLSAITSQKGVGTFSQVVPGEGGLCGSGDFNCDAGLAVLDGGPTGTSPFDGRFAVSGNNWLDSMDSQKMTISPSAGYNAIGFYMTDPNDAGGKFSVNAMGFDFEKIFQEDLNSGEIYYITIFDSAGLGDISIFSNNKDDGYGLDNVTVGSVAVTEPGTVALIGLGLIGLLLSRKRKQL